MQKSNNEGDWAGRAEIKTRKKFLAAVKACLVTGILYLLQARRTFVISEFSTEGTLISAFAVPH